MARYISIANGNWSSSSTWGLNNLSATSAPIHSTSSLQVNNTTRYTEYFIPDNASSTSIGILIMPISGLTSSQTITCVLLEGSTSRATATFDPSTSNLAFGQYLYVPWNIPYSYGNTSAGTWRVGISGTLTSNTFYIQCSTTSTSIYGSYYVNSNTGTYPGTNDYPIFITKKVNIDVSNIDIGDTAVNTSNASMVIDSGELTLKGSSLTTNGSFKFRGDLYMEGCMPQLIVGLQPIVQIKGYWAYINSTAISGQNTIQLHDTLYDGYVRQVNPLSYEPVSGDTIFIRGDNERSHELLTISAYDSFTKTIYLTTNLVYTHTVDPITGYTYDITATRSATTGTTYCRIMTNSLMTNFRDLNNLGPSLAEFYSSVTSSTPINSGCKRLRLDFCGDKNYGKSTTNWRNGYCFLSASSLSGSTTLVLQEDLQLNAGDDIIISGTPTGNNTYEVEQNRVLSYTGATKTITLTSALTYTHYQAVDSSTATLICSYSRNVNLQGENTNNLMGISITGCGGFSFIPNDGVFMGYKSYMGNLFSNISFERFMSTQNSNDTSALVWDQGNIGLLEGCVIKSSGMIQRAGGSGSIAGKINMISNGFDSGAITVGGSTSENNMYVDNQVNTFITASRQLSLYRGCKGFGFNITAASQGGILANAFGCYFYNCDTWGNKLGGYGVASDYFLGSYGCYFENCSAGKYLQNMTGAAVGTPGTSNITNISAIFLDFFSYHPTLCTGGSGSGPIWGPESFVQFQGINGIDENITYGSQNQAGLFGNWSIFNWNSQKTGTGYSDTTATSTGKNMRRIEIAGNGGEDRWWKIPTTVGIPFGINMKIKLDTSFITYNSSLTIYLLDAGITAVNNISSITISGTTAEQTINLVATPTKSSAVTLCFRVNSTSGWTTSKIFYVGDINVISNEQSSGDLESWQYGLPTRTLYNSTIQAQDVWTYPASSSALTSGTMGYGLNTLTGMPSTLTAMPTNVWSYPTSALTASSSGYIGNAFLRVLGQSNENTYHDNMTYTSVSGQERLSTARKRVYADSASVGSGSNIIATYNITATWNVDGTLATYAETKT